MNDVGKIVKCDRPGCENSCFRKYKGEGELDGGYTRYDIYEDMPLGWGEAKNPNNPKVHSLDFCPDCFKKYKDMWSEFMEALQITCEQ